MYSFIHLLERHDSQTQAPIDTELVWGGGGGGGGGSTLIYSYIRRLGSFWGDHIVYFSVFFFGGGGGGGNPVRVVTALPHRIITRDLFTMCFEK